MSREMSGWLCKALGNLNVDAILALQGFRHPVVSVDSSVGLQGVVWWVECRCQFGSTRYMSVDSLTGLQGSVYFYVCKIKA